MIVLDTNVVSEPLKASASPAVIDWLDRQPAETLFLTASLSELLVGVGILADGRRKSGLAAALNELVNRLFATRILPFDEAAAKTYAALVARARSGGLAIPVSDGQIAATTITRGFAVATRDISPFTAAGVPTMDPWSDDG
ncbi:MAG TPA: type II toxin-antitoxin system VapC family toxin [Caulobacteraceae bacterium]|nr:type II toxin-antitoxin system VapC family toxin [Caulobacteraceae bacterium]